MSESQNTKKKRPVLKPLLVAIIATCFVLIFILIAFLLAPQEPPPEKPEFDIALRDWNGVQRWEAHGRIAIFDDNISPGSQGEYEFILKNESDTMLRFGITLTEYLNTSKAAHPFMQYRLKMNGDYLGEGSAWRYATDVDHQNIEILPHTSQLITLEWYWDFNGDDNNDTLIGIAGGELSIHCLVLAEVM